VPLDIGRLATGYGMGVFSFVVGFSSTFSMKLCSKFHFKTLAYVQVIKV
jgi:hypothetical protein